MRPHSPLKPFKRLPFHLNKILKRIFNPLLSHESESAKLILLSEDTSLVRTLTERLEFTSTDSTYLRDRGELLKLIKTYEPDLLIYDPSRTEERVLSLVKDIRELRPNLPIIILSAGQDFLEEAEVMHLGLVRQLSKPVNMDLLVETINKLLTEVDKVKEGSLKASQNV